MTIEQTDVVDLISKDKKGNVYLTISDHQEWDEEMEHLYALQEKINKYLSFIESGEINEHCDDVVEKNIIINLVHKYEPNVAAINFLVKAKEKISEAGFSFKWSGINEK